MRLRLSILALWGLALIPGQAWAKPVEVVADISAGSHEATAIATGATAIGMGYLNVQMDGPLGEASAMMPGEVAATNAAILARNQHKTNAAQMSNETMASSLRQEATIIDLSPKTIMKFFHDVRSGDFGTQLREQLNAKWISIQEEVAKKFSEEALAASMENLIDDLLNCRTPQLDVLFPSINLDLGLAMCDYGQLFNNMKDQVDNIVDRGWGGQFKINGREARDYLKDPSLLKNAIHMIPPSQGHALTLDLLSDQSINASYQAKIDAASWAQQLAQMDKTRTLMRMIKPRTILDAQDENTDAVVKSSAINESLLGAQLQATNTGNQIEVLKYNEEQQEKVKQEIRENAAGINRQLRDGI